MGDFPELSTQDMIDFAVTYVAVCDWQVFVLSGAKVPVANCERCREMGVHQSPAEMDACGCLTCHGFHAATRDPDRITAMFTRHPGGQLAVRTGAASGICVVDVDRRGDGFSSLSRLRDAGLPDTPVMAWTGGDGMHLFYRHPRHPVKTVPKAFGSDMPGVDVKADGGYVVVHPSPGYRWLNTESYALDPAPWPPLLDRAMTPVPRTRVYGPPRRFHAPTVGGGAGQLAGLVQTVSQASEGERNQVLHWAARRAAEHVEADGWDRQHVADELASAAASTGLAPGGIRRTIGAVLHVEVAP